MRNILSAVFYQLYLPPVTSTVSKWFLDNSNFEKISKMLRFYLPVQEYGYRVPNTLSSSTHYSPISCHLSRSLYTRLQLLPAVLRKSSFHLAWGRLSLRLPRRGLHSRARLPQRLSVLRLICLHCHFSVLIPCAMSVTLTSLKQRLRIEFCYLHL
jgi:hypothetical protein